MPIRTLLFAAIVAATAVPAAEIPPAGDHAAKVMEWRAARDQRLREPDGWVSLIGLHWIEPGAHRVGSGPDNDIVIGAGPAHLGTLRREGGAIRFALADGVDATIGEGAAREAELASDRSGAPTLVRTGSVSFLVIERSGRFALRVRDAQAKTLTGFLGMDYYPIDASWVVTGRWEPHPAGTTIPIADVIGTLEPTPNPGAFVFERDGKTHRLEAVEGGPGQVWFIFADRTSGKTTYGAGRFLYAPAPAPGSATITVDFNLAYNPPCVFTPYATCPLPPPENRLDLAVTAGELKYRGESH